jgi:putative ABC transport system permease protein
VKSSASPPAFALRFFRWFCHPDLRNSIEGDLIKLYRERIFKSGKSIADVKFIIEVILLFRPSIIKPMKKSGNQQNHSAMYFAYLKIAVRSLWKNKASSFINVFGLTVGMTCCLLIGLYIQHELSFDKFQVNGDRIARVIMEYHFDGSREKPAKGKYTSTKVAPVFSRTFPEVESAVRMTDYDMIVRHNDKMLVESNFMFADSSFFKTFSFHLLQGNENNALNGPDKIVLTQSAAKKYFGIKDPVGEILLIGSEGSPYEVTGVMQDYPSNSQIKFDFLTSFSSMRANQERTYYNANYTTYLLLKDERSFGSLQSKITRFMKKEMTGSGSSINFYLEPFNKIHLYSEYAAFVPNTSINYLYILGGVAVLILVIVCFTFINLTTARSINRAREVGVRKVVGAAQAQLFWQFMSESFLICSLSILLSIQFAILALPYFNQLTEIQLSLATLFSSSFLIFCALITVLVSLFAGSYPALVLSGLQPVKVLKGVFKSTASGKSVQQSLIVFQFTISVLLIVSTVIIQKQLYFIQHKNLGYKREHVLVLPIDPKTSEILPTLKNQLKTNPNIISASRCMATPVNIAAGFSMRTTLMPENEVLPVNANPVDEDYIKTTGLQIIAGADFTEQDIRDANPKNQNEKQYHFILNESAAKQLGWTPEEAIGKTMFMELKGTVRGVVKDFHFQSMHNAIKPLILFPEPRGRQLLVKVAGGELPPTIAFLEQTWKQLVPQLPFDYKFLDDEYEKLYRSELQLGKVMNLFSGIAIMLACLGLFGLSSYVVQQRIKEIGIRKILGASLFSIVMLVSKNFVRLIIIALFIAFPLGYLLMDKWLQDFVYRVDIQWWVFFVAGIAAIGIALLTVSFQSIKVAVMNPVKSLKSE